MTIDQRCCGSSACIINDEGDCWCGQKWDGEKMCFPKADDHNYSPTQNIADPKPTTD